MAAWIIASACENPVESGHDEHSDAHGFLVMANGVEQARTVGEAIVGRLLVDLGDTTGFDVRFLDDSGIIIDPQQLEDDFALDVASSDAGIVEVVSVSNWRFRLVGRAADSTTIEIGLLHLPAEHHDFAPREVGVVVR